MSLARAEGGALRVDLLGEPAFARAETLAAEKAARLTGTPTAQPLAVVEEGEPANGATIVARALAGLTATARAPRPTRTPTPRPLSGRACTCQEVERFSSAMGGVHARRQALIDEWNAWLAAEASRQDAVPYEEAKAALDGFWARWEVLRQDTGQIETPTEGRTARDLFVQSVSQSSRAMEYLRDYYRSHDVDRLAKGNGALSEADRLYHRFGDAVDNLYQACPGAGA
ncbi:MAG: hypothetical protein ACYC4R_15110 [Anaerolineae bacterium]